MDLLRLRPPGSRAEPRVVQSLRILRRQLFRFRLMNENGRRTEPTRDARLRPITSKVEEEEDVIREEDHSRLNRSIHTEEEEEERFHRLLPVLMD